MSQDYETYLDLQTPYSPAYSYFSATDLNSLYQRYVQGKIGLTSLTYQSIISWDEFIEREYKIALDSERWQKNNGDLNDLPTIVSPIDRSAPLTSVVLSAGTALTAQNVCVGCVD